MYHLVSDQHDINLINNKSLNLLDGAKQHRIVIYNLQYEY